MWRAHREPLDGREGLRISLYDDDVMLSRARVLELWRTAADFRAFFNATLADLPWSAFRWETPPVTRDTLEMAFECVVFASPELAVPADGSDFTEHFRQAGTAEVVEFTNLGGDAHLIVPTPRALVEAYPHIGAFVRRAPESQRQELWRRAGESVGARIGARPIWLNTAGTGVPWLHLRLDTRPKYYLHAPYRVPP
jgi:hypothetical protein